MEYYSAIKRNTFESVLMRWMNLQPILQSEVSQKEKDKYHILRKGRGTRDQTANICWIIEKAREFQKNIYFCFIDYAKAFDCVDHNKCGLF